MTSSWAFFFAFVALNLVVAGLAFARVPHLLVNFERWPVLGESVWPNDPGAEERQTFEDEIAYLQSWLTARLAWMDSQLL